VPAHCSLGLGVGKKDLAILILHIIHIYADFLEFIDIIDVSKFITGNDPL